MAYLPGDVLEKLKKQAEKGGKYAEEVLKKNGGGKKEEQPAKPSTPSTPTITQILNNQTQQQQQTAQPSTTWNVQILKKDESNKTQQNLIDSKKQEEDALFKMIKDRAKQNNDSSNERLRAKTIRDNATKFDIKSELMRKGEESVDEVDKQSAKFAVDAKYKVKTVDVSNIDFAQGDVELWCISDTQKGIRESAELNGQIYIGRDNLDGASKEDKYVLYNKHTHELYQYSTDPEQKDARDRLQKAKDNYSLKATAIQQDVADLERSKQSAYQSLMDTVRDYHINLYGDLSDDELAIIQPFIDRYSAYEDQLNDVIIKGDKTLNLYRDGIDTLEQYKGDGSNSVNDYAVQKAIMTKYTDLQAVYNGEMTGTEFQKKYNEMPSVSLLNKCAQDSKNAASVLDKMNGTLFDDLGIADECNSMASDLLLQDEITRQAIIDNANSASGKFDMSNKKQVNSMIDVYRRAFVTMCLDNKGDIAGKLKAVPNFIKDSEQYWDKVKETLKLSKDEDNINTGLSGVLLSWMSDAGDLFTSLGSAAFDAAGLAGTYEISTSAMKSGIIDKSKSVISNSFKEGVLSNEDYYLSRAQNYKDGNNLKAFFNNYGLILEAYARGDLDAELDITKVQSISNGINTTAQLEEHPLVTFAINMAMGIALDPTTYVGGVADDIISKSVPDKLVTKYSDEVIDVLRKSNVDDSLIDADKINKIIKNECISAVKEGRKQFDDTALMRIVNEYTTPLNIDVTENNRVKYVKNLYDNAKKAIDEVSMNPEIAKLWEDSAKIMKTGKTIQDIDHALNAFQLGPVAAVLPSIKHVGFALKGIGDTTVVKNSTKAIANWWNQFAYNATKYFNRGSEGLKEFDAVQNVFKASFNIDIIEDAIKNGDSAVFDLDEFNKISDNLRTEYAKGIIGRELDTVHKSISARIGISDLLKDTATPTTVQDLAESVAKHNVIKAEDLDNIVITLTNGTRVNYGDYIDNLRSIAKGIDTPDAGFRVTTEIEYRVNRIESLTNLYNTTVVREKVRLANACLRDGSEESLAILKGIDVSDIAPELQEQLSNIAIIDNDNLDAIKKIVDEYTNAYGAIAPKAQFDSFKKSIKITEAIESGKYVTPEQYIEHCLSNAGVQPDSELYTKIIKDSVDKYGDIEIAGKIYEFIESAEANMNGILQNKDLRNILSDEDLLNTLRSAGLDKELRSIANLDAIETAEYILYNSLPAEHYHSIMDTIAGSYETINKYARQYRDMPSNRSAIIDECVSYIKAHNSNTIARGLNYTVWLDNPSDTELVRTVLSSMFMSMSDDCLSVIPTRDSVYSTLLSLDEKILNHSDPTVQKLSIKIEKAIESGSYTTCNNELGKVLYGEALNKYITDIADLPKEYHVDHMQNIAEYLVKGESVQLKTLIDLDRTKTFIPEDLISKVLNKGKAITEELNDYTRSLGYLYNKFSVTMPKLSVDDLECLRTVINNMCSNLTEPAELRYLEYFNSIDFTDDVKAFSAIVDISARLGVDLDTAAGLATFRNPAITDIIGDYADNLYMYMPTNSELSSDVVKLNNLVQKQLSAVEDAEHSILPTLYSKDHNSFKMREELYNALGITDGASRASLYRKQEISDEIFNRYNAVNRSGVRPNEAISELSNFERKKWNDNVQKVISWDKETLDKALLCTHSNAIVCDVNKYPELAQWLIEREADGYIVTRTQLGGTTVQILSMDFNACTPEYKKYLRDLKFKHGTMPKVTEDDIKDPILNFRHKVNRAVSECSYKFEDTNFTASSNYNKVNMDFHNELQQLIPEQCRLDAEFTKMHNRAFVGNMLVEHELANAVGATRGHILGNCYYAECAELNNLDSLGTLEDIISVDNNSVKYWMDHNKTSTYGGKAGFEYLYKQVKDSGYHIISLDSSDVADVGKKYKITDVTDLYDFDNYTINDKLSNVKTNPRYDKIYTDTLTGKNHFIVDNITYKYLNGEISANNRMMQYYTTPALIHKVYDIVDNYRRATITGLLYASNIKGTGVRNIIDSNTKALAEVGLEDSKEYLGNWYHALDAKQSYVEQMAKIYDETGKQGVQGINEYIEKHIDDLDFDAKELMLNHTIFTLNEMDDEVAIKCREIYNNKLLDSCTFAIDKESKDSIIKAFNTTRDKHWLDKNYRTPEQMEEFLRTELTKVLADKHSVNADEQISELTKLYGKWQSGSAEHWYTKMFDDNNIVGRNLSSINKKTFDDAETRCRYALMRTLMDNGESSSSAIRKVVKTQFDYGTQRGIAGGWDKIMPFAKYQFANAAYWLDCTNYSSFTLSNMRRLTQATQPLQSNVDAVKTAIAIEYYKRKNGTANTEQTIDDSKSIFEATISDVIENYKGVKASSANGIGIDNHHYLKVGNGFFDTMDWIATVMCAPGELRRGEIPSILQDTVFGPAKTLPVVLPKLTKMFFSYLRNPDDTEAYDDLYRYLKGYTDKDGNYVYGQMSNVIGCVPVFGQLFNLCCTVSKNVVANKNLLALALCSEGCTDGLLKSLAVQAGALGFGILNSIVGTRKENVVGKKIFTPYTDEEGVRHTWSELTEDEKSRYTFLPGISNDRMWALTPSARYGLYGRLAEYGLDKKAIRLLTNRWLCTNPAFKIVDGDNVYTDTDVLETVVIDMLNNGYTIGEITYLITATDRWYDVRKHQIIKSDAEMQRYFMNQAFLAEYNLIPDYIKYQPDMYSEMMAHYKALGYDTREAWRLMRTDNAYIDENRQFRTLTAEQANDYTKWLRDEYYEGQADDGFLEWYATLPDYIQYEKGAYSRTLAYLKQMFSAEEAKQMIANGAYYTADGRLINCTDLHRAHGKKNTAFQDAQGYWHKATDFQVNGYWFHEGDNPYLGYKDFNDYYKHLPQYTQFTKGCFKQTNQVLKEAGFDYNTRMQAMLDGAVAMEIDPNSETFKAYLAKQQIVAVTKTVYVDKQVPLRECTLVNGKWQWNGPQTVKVTNLGNGYTTEQVTKDMEFNAASMGVTQAAKWKSYDSAMVTVKVPQTVVTAEQDPDQIMYRIVTMGDKTYIIVPAPEYTRPRGGYYKKGSPKSWTKRRNYTRNYNNYEKSKRYKNYYGYNNKPMHIKYSNVRTYSKQHFLQQQSDGYKYWTQWGDGNMTNHRNRNGRMHYPSTYRNPRVKQRSIYKDLYAKYGASRINARQNIAGYSNASITRFRRNDIANRSYNIKVNSARI